MTPVGLLPIAVAGIDIAKMMEGASASRELYLNSEFEANDAMNQAVAFQNQRDSIVKDNPKLFK